MESKLFSGKYEIQGEIARGGMGVIFKALHTTLNRIVAIKVLHGQFSGDPAFLKRFQREARAMARLDHDNIIRVFDVAEDTDGSQYIVMEFFDGSDLKRMLLEKGKLSTGEVLSMGIQIGEALSYAHSQGIVHRDVKPGNIMVDKRGRIKIADFGIAAASDEMSVTVTGQIIGTPEYMSPEQAKGEHLDGRSDLYSLGMVFFEMLKGNTPFEGVSRMAIVGKLLYEKEELTLHFGDHVPARLQEVIRSLVRKNAEERIPTAQILVNQLEEIRNEFPKEFVPKAPLQNEDENEKTVILPQPKPKTSTSIKAPVKIKAPSVPPVREIKKEEKPLPFPSNVKSQFPGWITGAMAGIGFVVLVAVGIYAYFSFSKPSDPPQVADNKTESPVNPMTDVRELQNRIREIQEQIIKSRGEAESADARRWASDLYQSAVSGEERGAKALQDGSTLINQRDYEKSKPLLEDAKNALSKANEEFVRAKETAVGKKSENEKALALNKQSEQRKRMEKEKALAKIRDLEAKKREKEVVVLNKISPAVHSPSPTPPVSMPPVSTPAEPKPDMEVVGKILSKFRSAYENRDLIGLRSMSAMSEERNHFLQGLFKNFNGIKISIADFSLSHETVSAQVVINKLSTATGENVVPGQEWKKAKITIRKENGVWGKVIW
jgi:serine/threonine protein kinase